MASNKASLRTKTYFTPLTTQINNLIISIQTSLSPQAIPPITKFSLPLGFPSTPHWRSKVGDSCFGPTHRPSSATVASRWLQPCSLQPSYSDTRQVLWDETWLWYLNLFFCKSFLRLVVDVGKGNSFAVCF